MKWAQLNTDTPTATLRKAKRRGFTIVELLIVIVVIAILAAIALVAYTGIQSRAAESAIRADFTNFAKRMELYRVDQPSGQYPTSYTEFNAEMGIKFSSRRIRHQAGTAAMFCTVAAQVAPAGP